MRDSCRNSKKRSHFHVAIMANMMQPRAKGNHPPANNFRAFAAKNGTSMIKRTMSRTLTKRADQSQLYRATEQARIVVITIVPVTAIPYAAARLLDSLNAITTTMTATNSIQLINGKYICPASLSEVCLIVMPGRYPRRTACRVNEKTPDITAWEAMTVANVASITIGTRAQFGANRKNGLVTASGFRSNRAPWPK